MALTMTIDTQTRDGLEAAIRAAKLALFVIRKQGIMPNSSWQAGFEKDLKTAEDAMAALRINAEIDIGRDVG